MEGRGVYYSEPSKPEIRSWTMPELSNDEVLLKVAYCGICRSDHHVVNGDLGEIARFPPTIHEVVGCVVKTGKNVQDLFEGDRCVADPITRCHKCFFCRRGQYVQCINSRVIGINTQGGFSDHTMIVQSNKLHKIFNVSDEEATLIEPLFCAVHTVDKIASAVVPMSLSSALALVVRIIGVMISQLLELNGASRVALVSNKGIKMDVAKQVNAADKYLELNRHNPEEQWKKFKEDNPFGFNVVVEASGSARLLVDSVRLVRRGGTLALRHLWRSLGIMACHPNLCQRNSQHRQRKDQRERNGKKLRYTYLYPVPKLHTDFPYLHAFWIPEGT
ncbi:zinc-containing alcohol [Moniliophthora roreri MCA 2997]|uniref:Zinc-containing alcohol n=1 Tax=Moniliophthora roreri (strain MCA 2997) TaxID=1381753 RepID=V2XU41_MONRO|nr:zinc-containing alcohol [Moniliophthora roreri MCA 2997]